MRVRARVHTLSLTSCSISTRSASPLFDSIRGMMHLSCHLFILSLITCLHLSHNLFNLSPVGEPVGISKFLRCKQCHRDRPGPQMADFRPLPLALSNLASDSASPLASGVSTASPFCSHRPVCLKPPPDTCWASLCTRLVLGQQASVSPSRSSQSRRRDGQETSDLTARC